VLDRGGANPAIGHRESATGFEPGSGLQDTRFAGYPLHRKRIQQSECVTGRIFAFLVPDDIEDLHPAHERSKKLAAIPFSQGKKCFDSIGTGFVATQGKESGRVENELIDWRHFLVADPDVGP